MKVKLKRWMQIAFVCVCVLALLCPMTLAYADELDSMESESSDLQSELDNINGELIEIGNQIAENEVKIESVNSEIEKTQEQLAIAKKNEEQQYEDMQLRIQYIYENDGESLLGMIVTAESLADFVNRVDFVKTLNEYDRNMVLELQALRENIEDCEKHLEEQQEESLKLQEELNAKKAELNAKAQQTSTDLETLEEKIQAMKKEKADRAAAAAAAAAASAQQSQSSGGGNNSNTNTGNSSGQTSGGRYNYPSGPGQLNPWVGVVQFGNHKETYYSQRVLPGHGLNIPGRHVASDGTIRDANGYLCLASSDYEKGTVIETSLGLGIVYDSGCASGIVDIYTDW